MNGQRVRTLSCRQVFSTASTSMEKAMIHSTVVAAGIASPSVASASVMLWPTVNPVTSQASACQRRTNNTSASRKQR